jgi:hypothetical protein
MSIRANFSSLAALFVGAAGLIASVWRVNYHSNGCSRIASGLKFFAGAAVVRRPAVWRIPTGTSTLELSPLATLSFAAPVFDLPLRFSANAMVESDRFIQSRGADLDKIGGSIRMHQTLFQRNAGVAIKTGWLF